MVNNKLCTDVGPHTNVNIFTLKNVTWRTYLITFTVQCCFLFRFVSIELVSLIWVLQIWVAIYVYGNMINWSSLIKKLMQTYIVIVSGSILNVSTVHLNGIWHLIWRYLSKPVSGGSLSIRRFWGKGERWERKREGAELSLLPLPPPPSKISSPLALRKAWYSG